MKKAIFLTLVGLCSFFSLKTQAEDMKLVLTLDGDDETFTWTQPMVADVDGDGLADLLVSYLNNVRQYEQDSPGVISFTLSDSSITPTLQEIYSPTLTDLDGDGLLDLVSYYGSYQPKRYEQRFFGSFSFNYSADMMLESFDYSIHGRYPDHATYQDIDGDGLLDMLMGYGSTHSSGSAYGTDQERNGSSIIHYEQDSTDSNTYNLVTEYFNDITNRGCCGLYPVLVKLNPDSDLWHLISDGGNGLLHYRQKEKNSYEFELITDEFGGIEDDEYLTPFFYDLNGDKTPELILGRRDGGIRIYQCEDHPYYEDEDKDGYGDAANSKVSCYIPDGNYVDNNTDVFPLDSTENADTDQDGIGNNTDTDDDGDEVEDIFDDFPLDPSETTDTDGDGIGDNAEANQASGSGGCSLSHSILQ